MKNDETPGKDPEDNMLGTIKHEDGSAETITTKEFLERLKMADSYDFSRNPNANDKETFRKLVQILGAILDANFKHPEVFKDVKNREELKAYYESVLQKIDEYLDRYNLDDGPQTDDRILEFLKGQREFMPVARPRGIEDFLKINDDGREVKRQFKNSNITFSGHLGQDEQKIAELLRMSFTEINPYKAKSGLKTLVSLSLTEVMNRLGRTTNPENKKMFVRRLNREILPTIHNTHISLETISDKHVETISIFVGGGYFKASTKSDKIIFRFSPEYAQYLNTNSLSQYHRNTFRLGNARNPLPYYLCVKLQNHYYKDANRQRGTNMILSVSSLLEFCADTLQYYDILETDPTHWKRKIKERLEKALDEIQKIGIFKWQYCGPGLKEIPQAEVDAADFHEWSEKKYITFQLIPEEPDESERLQNKRERIEAAKERKAIEDARAKVEVEKIRKRKQRRAASKTKKGNAQAPKG